MLCIMSKRPSFPMRKAFWHLFYHSAEGANLIQQGQIKHNSCQPWTHQPTENRGKGHKVYFSITQSALSICSRNLFHSIISMQLPCEPPTQHNKRSRTGCSHKDTAQPLLVRPPAWLPASPPTHCWSSAHSISKSLAPLSWPATEKVGLHLECSVS